MSSRRPAGKFPIKPSRRGASNKPSHTWLFDPIDSLTPKSLQITGRSTRRLQKK